VLNKIKENLLISGLVLGATVGAGLFVLPGVFAAAGWAIGLISMFVVVLSISFAHSLFWRALAKSGGGNGLLALIKEKLGKWAGGVAFWTLVGGLTLTLAAYLNLGAGFLTIIFPSLGTPLLVFWMAASLPALFGLKKLVRLDIGVVSAMVVLILFIFFSAPNKSAVFLYPAALGGGAIASFGALLFSLAGWTAVEPALKLSRGKNGDNKAIFLGLGTVFSAVLFLLFITGIFGSSPTISGDTISGLASWPGWKLGALALLGTFTILSVHMMISAEIKRSLASNYGHEEMLGILYVIFIPLLLVLAGLNEFQETVSLAGGVFLAGQYIFILLVSKKILGSSGAEKFFANFLIFIFSLSALYQAYAFIVK